MSRLLLVAASGLAREALVVVRGLRPATQVRVLDDDPDLWGGTLDGAPVVGGVDDVVDYDDHDVVVCAGRGTARRRIVERLRAQGVEDERFATVVHPRAEVPAGCVVGRGSVVLAGVVMTASVTVGEHVVLMPHVTLTHDDLVADYATLAAGVALGGGVRVEEGAYLGMSAAVREGRVVGRDAVLGMGAVLVRDLPPGETWAGVPARGITELTGARA